MNDDNSARTGVTGDHTSAGVPHGFTSLTPFLAIPRAAEAAEYYQSVFGARILDLTEMGGVVVHAELDFGNGRLQMGEPNAAFGLALPPEGDGDCYSIGLYCADVDAVVERAERAGATIREGLTTFVSGDRYASIRDPFGVRWSIMTRVEDLSDEESAQRVQRWVQAQEASNEQLTTGAREN